MRASIFAVAVPIYLIELSHSTWPAPLRYAEDVRDWTVTLEDGETVATFLSTGFDAEAAGSDDSGIDTRNISLPDTDGVLWARLEDLRGNDEPVRVTIRVYASDDLSEPDAVAVLHLQGPARDGDAVSFTATTKDTINRDAPWRRFTWENSPGLRGR